MMARDGNLDEYAEAWCELQGQIDQLLEELRVHQNQFQNRGLAPNG
jgi:hypothetical protein